MIREIHFLALKKCREDDGEDRAGKASLKAQDERKAVIR